MEAKPWYLSMGMIGSLVAIIVFGVKALGLDLGDERENVTALVTSIVGVVAGIIALIGRIKAKKSISNPLSGEIGKCLLLLLLPCICLAGCTRLPLSQAARVDLASTLAATKTLKPKCEAGDDAACGTMLAVEHQVLARMAHSIYGTDPNYSGYVGRMASNEYKLQILKAYLLASHSRDGCEAGDPNFCRNALNLYVVIQRLQAGAAGTN